MTYTILAGTLDAQIYISIPSLNLRTYTTKKNKYVEACSFFKYEKIYRILILAHMLLF